MSHDVAYLGTAMPTTRNQETCSLSVRCFDSLDAQYKGSKLRITGIHNNGLVEKLNAENPKHAVKVMHFLLPQRKHGLVYANYAHTYENSPRNTKGKHGIAFYAVDVATFMGAFCFVAD
eukprot:2469956-Amphidinium_carterae.1